ncbi:MAG: DNA primase [Deltaproteobacteria bacterium]|nr:DNA primase [Deltaproteobacteria bacterium]MCB9786845.1 DNA primase [Deltaproteobacteria bacterium]
MRFDDTLLQEIRDRNSLVQVVGDYVSLRKAGNNHVGLCPFHSERSPSFSVNEQRQFFYCFGCQTGGDVIAFVRELHGYSFIEAVRHLADRVGIAVPDAPRGAGASERPGGERAPRVDRRSKDAYFAIGRSAREYFTETLQGLRGAAAREYVRERGISADTATRFALGLAPDGWDGLSQHLASEGFDARLAESAGLVAARKDGSGFYDRFRSRLMFPIRNLAGEVVAFGGRILPGFEQIGDEKVAKYINSPETPVYTKGKALFGLYEARRALRQTGYAVVVEGNVDVLMVSQAGIEHVLAPMGTALTPEQCQLLRRFVPRVVLLYDGDNAGRAAARKGVPVALAEGLQVGVVTLPDGQDPDTFVRTQGAEALAALIERAVPGWDFLVEATIDALGVRQDRRAGAPRAVDQLAPVLDGMPDRRERLLYQRSLAGALGLSDSDLADFLRDARARQRPGAGPDPGGPEQRAARPSMAPPPWRELKLLMLLLEAAETRPVAQGRDVQRLLTHPGVREALELLWNLDDEQPGVPAAVVASSVSDGALKTQLFEALARGHEHADGRRELDELVMLLEEDQLKRERVAAARPVREASSRQDDTAATAALFAELALARQIQSRKDSKIS